MDRVGGQRLRRTGGKKEVYRGSAYVVDFIPKVRIQIIVDDDLVQPIVEAILATARTGEIGMARSLSVPWSTPSAFAPASAATTRSSVSLHREGTPTA